MPVFNSQFFEADPSGGHKLGPSILAHVGPVLAVSVSIPQALADLYTRQQIPLPTPVTGIALIDTGATKSCVHGPIMGQLGVNPIGVITGLTAAGQVRQIFSPRTLRFRQQGLI